MKTPTEPADPGPTLGPPIRPTPAPAPDPIKAFELGDWSATLPKGLAEKPTTPPAPPLDAPIIFWPALVHTP